MPKAEQAPGTSIRRIPPIGMSLYLSRTAGELLEACDQVGVRANAGDVPWQRLKDSDSAKVAGKRHTIESAQTAAKPKYVCQ